jgi:hypothetical protein
LIRVAEADFHESIFTSAMLNVWHSPSIPWRTHRSPATPRPSSPRSSWCKFEYLSDGRSEGIKSWLCHGWV